MTEKEIIERLRRAPGTNEQRIIALYMAGLPANKVWEHIRKRTFSGARAIEHITAPHTSQAIMAWRRGLEICYIANVPVKRTFWDDRINDDLLCEETPEGHVDQSACADTGDNQNVLHGQKVNSADGFIQKKVDGKDDRGRTAPDACKKALSILVIIVKKLAQKYREKLETLKKEGENIVRPDFIWHYLLQSFATMGRASGWDGLIANKNNYNKLRYDVLERLSPEERKNQVQRVCREAGIRMPDKKAQYILSCFEMIKKMGGPMRAKEMLLSQPGRDRKISFLMTFPGIGEKYARNIMMDVYHEDFRDSIAIDSRIEKVTQSLGLSFDTYEEHEQFYLGVAREAGINGWELDRLLFNFNDEVIMGIKEAYLGWVK
ncbi:MAG: hypothetical protein N2572_04460 [Syntrophales bacterium]|nr:hypothetical protein [Syntrophales bacterium]